MSSKALRYLKKLSSEDWKDFEAYLASPLLGNSRVFVRLLGVLQGLVDDDKSFSLVGVHEALYPADCYEKCYLEIGTNGSSVLAKGRVGHIKRNLSELLERLYDFWGFKEAMADQAALGAYRLRGLAKYGEVGDFQRCQSKLEQDGGDARVCDASRLLDRAANAILATEVVNPQGKDRSANRFQNPIDLLDQGYLLAALDLACKAHNHDYKHHENGENKHRMPRFLKHVDLEELAMQPGLMQILTFIYRMYVDTAVKSVYFQQAKSALMSLVRDQTEGYSLMLEDLMGHLINFAAREALAEADTFVPELQVLYEFALEHGIFLKSGQLSWSHYQNATNVLMKVRSYDWVAEFLVRYRHQLPRHLESLLFSFNWGVLQFRRKNYREAWQAFIVAENDPLAGSNVELAMQLKAFQVVMEYEVGEYERFQSRAHNMVVWLKQTHGLPRKRSSRYLRFARFARRMARVRLSLTVDAAVRKWEALRASFMSDNDEDKILRDWLQEKLEAGLGPK